MLSADDASDYSTHTEVRKHSSSSGINELYTIIYSLLLYSKATYSDALMPLKVLA